MYLLHSQQHLMSGVNRLIDILLFRLMHSVIPIALPDMCALCSAMLSDPYRAMTTQAFEDYIHSFNMFCTKFSLANR